MLIAENLLVPDEPVDASMVLAAVVVEPLPVYMRLVVLVELEHQTWYG